MKKVLGFTVADWDGLPWHYQRMYLEELAADLTGRRSDGPPDHYHDDVDLGEQLADGDAEQFMRSQIPDDQAGTTDRPSWLTLPITKVAAFGE